MKVQETYICIYVYSPKMYRLLPKRALNELISIHFLETHAHMCVSQRMSVCFYTCWCTILLSDSNPFVGIF